MKPAAGVGAPDAVDLRWAAALFHENGVIEETGVAAAVLNHPANGIAWRANKLAVHDIGLEPGRLPRLTTVASGPSVAPLRFPRPVAAVIVRVGHRMGSSMEREIIEVPVISAAIRRLGAPTSALVRAGDFLLTCGMPPIDIASGEIVQGDITIQTKAALEALRVTLEYAGSSPEKVVKTTIYVTDAALMPAVNEAYRAFFHAGFPARTSAAIKPWPLPFDIEIECMALV